MINKWRRVHWAHIYWENGRKFYSLQGFRFADLMVKTSLLSEKCSHKYTHHQTNKRVERQRIFKRFEPRRTPESKNRISWLEVLPSFGSATGRSVNLYAIRERGRYVFQSICTPRDDQSI
jgi:hypothetical protein